jgi:hypothetical protein
VLCTEQWLFFTSYAVTALLEETQEHGGASSNFIPGGSYFRVLRYSQTFLFTSYIELSVCEYRNVFNVRGPAISSMASKKKRKGIKLVSLFEEIE